MSVALTDSRTMLAFKAGRAFRRPGTNFVDASPAKGAIVLSKDENLLVHFMWKDRTTGGVGEDLILFPGDAKFEKVSQSSWGRTYVLQFESSDQKHFFWMQDSSTRRDEEFVRHLNRVLSDPEIIPVWDLRNHDAEPEASTSATGASTPAQQSAPAASTSAPAGTTPEQLAQLRALVGSMTGGTSEEDQFSLSDVLTPQNLQPLFQSHPDLLPSLFPHLPPEFLPPSDPTPRQTAELTEMLQRTINSPPFRSSVAQLDRALRTGALGSFVRSLGLPESAAMGVGAFLAAIAEQARQEGGSEEQMEED